MSEPDDDKTQTHVTLTGGTMVSLYQIIEKIGAGGMGEAYLAEDTELNRQIAMINRSIRSLFCTLCPFCAHR